MIKAVLFDIGGTLLTVENNDELRLDFAKRLIRRLDDYKITLSTTPEALVETLRTNTAAYKRFSEETLLELPADVIWADYYLKGFSISRETIRPIAEELCFLYNGYREKVLPRPNVADCVEALDRLGMRQGIISNIISKTFAPYFCKICGIDRYMELILMSSEVGIKKPNPAIFNIALREMQLKPEEVCYVGDTVSRDLMGCRNAHIGICVLISNPVLAEREAAVKGAENLKADYYIQDLMEIPALIRQYNEACR